MKIKTLQWNIGGAKIRKEGNDPTLDSSYKTNGLEHVIKVIAAIKPDIITLQEAHASKNYVQASAIAADLHGAYYVNQVYNTSHLEPEQELSLAVISEYPITKSTFTNFHNPKYQIKQPDGEIWTSHDKGILDCELIMGTTVQVSTLHMIPYEMFKVNPMGEEALELRKDLANKIACPMEFCLIQGDFNFDKPSLKEFIPTLFEKGAREVIQNEPTRPNGRKHDHVVYKGFKLLDSKVIKDVRTDHYPVYTEFELEI